MGRKKGSVNKVTKQLKDMILGALSDVGGQEYLARQARENPGAFMALIGKVLPTTLAGDKANPLEVSVSFEEQRRQAVEAVRAAFEDEPK